MKPKWKVTLTKENLSRATVWVDADTIGEAKDNAFKEPKIKDFVDGYDGLYTISILTEEQLTKFQIFQKDNRNGKKESRIKVKE